MLVECLNLTYANLRMLWVHHREMNFGLILETRTRLAGVQRMALAVR
jgi:hypothetical protein